MMKFSRQVYFAKKINKKEQRYRAFLLKIVTDNKSYQGIKLVVI